jgi:hypothetical protein
MLLIFYSFRRLDYASGTCIGMHLPWGLFFITAIPDVFPGLCA